MKIGYFSNLNLNRFSNIDTYVNKYVESSIDEGLDILICVGGISNNYLITKDFTTRLGNALKSESIVFRFVVGNTDFYYSKSEFSVDKEGKFRNVLRDYRNNEYYLPTHALRLRNKVVITGLESWYDYTLYRGSGCDLKDITKKSYAFGIKNKDVVYITNATDYTLGIEDTFDVRYSNECLEMMKSKLTRYTSSYGLANRNIVVMYFSPVKSMFGDSSYNKYMSTFKGSLKYQEPLIQNAVHECIVGCKCKNRFVNLRGMSLIGTNKTIYVEEIADEEDK